MVAANKSILARLHDAPDWRVVRPPLTALTDAQEAQLFGAIEALGFELSPVEAAVA